MRYWSGVIDDIPLEDGAANIAAFDLTGAGGFEMGDTTGNSVPSINGTLQTQYADAGEGKLLELKFLHIPKVLLTALLASLTATLPAGDSVVCSFTDGYQTIAGNFKPNVPNWYERGLPDGDYIQDAVIRLAYTGA